ncbi:MAG: lipocalin family protein [Bacteroidia bacterium]
MKTLQILILSFLFVSGFSYAQSGRKASSGKKEISQEQKNFLQNTWFESPKESEGGNIVYRLTEYTVIVGQDFYNFTPGKLILTASGDFSSENLKLNLSQDPHQTDSGTWKLNGNTLILYMGNELRKFPIVSISQDKLVLEIK